MVKKKQSKNNGKTDGDYKQAQRLYLIHNTKN